MLLGQKKYKKLPWGKVMKEHCNIGSEIIENCLWKKVQFLVFANHHYMCFGQAETQIWACLTPNRTQINKPSLDGLGVLELTEKLQMVNHLHQTLSPVKHASHYLKVDGEL